MKTGFQEENTSRNGIPQASAVSGRPGANVTAALPPAARGPDSPALQGETAHLFGPARRGLGTASWETSRRPLQAGTRPLVTERGVNIVNIQKIHGINERGPADFRKLPNSYWST